VAIIVFDELLAPGGYRNISWYLWLMSWSQQKARVLGHGLGEGAAVAHDRAGQEHVFGPHYLRLDERHLRLNPVLHVEVSSQQRLIGAENHISGPGIRAMSV
jgi:hypothetical protein